MTLPPPSSPGSPHHVPSAAPPRVSFQGGTLLLQGWDREAGPRWLLDLGAVWDGRVGAWRLDAIRYADIAAPLSAAAEKAETVGPPSESFLDEVPKWRSLRWPKIDLPALREEQTAAVASWQASGRGLVVMPTGTGKTVVALKIMADAAVSSLVVAPVRDLMYQWHRRIFEALGYDAGVIGDGVHRVRPVSVTTYDSACIHMEKFGDQFGLLIFDECHHLPGQIRRDAARMSAAPLRLGLTATPHRADGRHIDLDELIGPVVYLQDVAAARGRTLADYDVVRIPVKLSAEEQSRYDELSRQVRSYMVERRKELPAYSWQDLCGDAADTPEARRALIAYHAKQAIEDRAEEKLRVLEDLFRLHHSEPCLVFVGSNAMARDVSRRFLIPCLLAHSRKQERLEVLQGLERGDYPALVANQVLDEGVDLPEVKVAMVIGGSASSRQAKQRLGRVLRRRGNTRAVLYEIVTAETNEEKRSRTRRRSDAYAGTKRWKK